MRTSRAAAGAMAIGFAFAALLSGCSLLPSGSEAAPELLKPVKQQAELLDLKRSSITNELNFVGTVVPLDTSFVKFTTDGKVAQILAKPGDMVNKGDTLFRLDRGTLDLDLMKQRLALENARLALRNVMQSQDESTIGVARMDVEIEQLKLNRLLNKEASLQVVSPKAGVVTFVEDLKPGDAVVPYRDVLAVADPQALQVNVMVSLSDAALIRDIEAGMPVEATIGGRKYSAHVAQTPATAPPSTSEKERDLNSRTLLIRFDSAPQDAALGNNAFVRIVTAQKDNVIKIPRVALRSYQGRDFVQIMDGDTRKEVDVVRGLQTATEVEIAQGLKEGQQVILNN